MFKKITVFAMALLLVTGCSKDEVKKEDYEEKEDGTKKTETKTETKKDAPNFKFTKISVTSDAISSASILKNVTDGDTTGWSIKSISNISDSDIASFDSGSLKFKKFGKITATITLEKSGYKYGSISGCEFERVPGEITITAISILKFPALKSSGDTWDKKQFWQPVSIRNPDLIWKIKNGDNTLFSLSAGSRAGDASGGKSWTFNKPVAIKKGIDYEFHLWDYDTLSKWDKMGQVNFSVPDDYPDTKIFKSADKKIEIKVYFTYLK